MKTNKIIILSATFISFGLCTGCSNINGLNNVESVWTTTSVNLKPRPEKYEKKSNFIEAHYKTEMPIFGYISMPCEYASDWGLIGENPSYINYSSFKLYKDAGFNAVIPLYSAEAINTVTIRKEIEVCNELDLGYLLKDNRFLGVRSPEDPIVSEDTYFDMLNDPRATWYIDEPCVVGLQTRDEPDYDDLANINNFSKALAEFDDTKWSFTNLFPQYAADYQLGLSDLTGTMSHDEIYHKYVEFYLDNSNSSYVLFDYYLNHVYRYPMSIDSTYGFFSNMSYFANEAHKRNIPFMVAVVPFRHGTNSQMRIQELRWTVNASLAYGAKGLEYYTYWPAIGGIQQSAWAYPYRSGLVSANGIPHDSYYHAKEVNENVQVVDEVLMASNFLGISLFGNVKTYIDKKDIIEYPDPLCDITGGDSLVGVFDHNGKTVYYVVNNNYDDGSNTFVAKFNKKSKVHLLSSKYDDMKEDRYAVGFTLEAGEAVLIEVL